MEHDKKIIAQAESLSASGMLSSLVFGALNQALLTDREGLLSLLRDRHRIRPGQDDDFMVRNLADMADLADQQARLFTVLLASIASISLLVGGIGIMNIMLVSVTERTREIGIRMAIGATPADVLTQFLIEAILLSLVGGMLGITLGALGAISLAWFAANDPLRRPVSVHFSHPWQGERLWRMPGLGFSNSNAYTGFQSAMRRLAPS